MVEGIITYNRYPNNNKDEMQGGGMEKKSKSKVEILDLSKIKCFRMRGITYL